MFFLPKSIFKYLTTSRSLNLFPVDALLSRKNRAACMEKFAASTAAAWPQGPGSSGKLREAAVLVTLCVRDGELALVYTLRAAGLKTHRGQVSFPGGMRDAQDTSLQATALRENEEELGIPAQEVEVWGSGAALRLRDGLQLLPVVGSLRRPFQPHLLRLNRGEVDEVFTVRLRDLCDPRLVGHTQFRGAHSTPVFLGGRRRVWGITAAVTHLFLQALLPPETYRHSAPRIASVARLPCPATQ